MRDTLHEAFEVLEFGVPCQLEFLDLMLLELLEESMIASLSRKRDTSEHLERARCAVWGRGDHEVASKLFDAAEFADSREGASGEGKVRGRRTYVEI